MEIRVCNKLVKGSVVYIYNINEQYIQIKEDLPENGGKGGTFSKKCFSFGELNNFLNSLNGNSFVPLQITAYFGISCSNTGSMLTAILIDCGVVEKIRQGEYRATARRL